MKTSLAEKIRLRWVRKATDAGIEIPNWVPERLMVEFCDCAINFGEEQAASHIRKIKRDLDQKESA